MKEAAGSRYVMGIAGALVLCIMFAVWGMGDVLFLVAISLASVFFSLRFGIGLSVCTVLLTLLTVAVKIYMSDGSFLLNRETAGVFARLFAMDAFALLLSIYVRRVYEKLQRRSHRLQEENHGLKWTVRDLEKQKQDLQQELQKLEALRRMEAVFHETNPERLTDKMVLLLHEQFGAEQVAVYCVDAPQQKLRLKVRHGNPRELPYELGMEKEQAFYSRLFLNRKLTVRVEEDSPTAPLLAVPIQRGREIWRVLMIQEMKSYRGSSQEFLAWLLHTVVERYEAAYKPEEQSFHEGTSIMRFPAFVERLGHEKQREQLFHQPYQCIGLYIRELNLQRLPQLQPLLYGLSAEPNAVAYDERARVLYVLIPGCGTQELPGIRRELEERLKQGDMHVVNWTMLQQEPAV